MSSQITLHMVRHAPVIGQSGRIYGDDVEVDLDNHHHTIAQLARELPGTDQALWLCSGVDRTLRTGARILTEMNAKPALMKTLPLFKEQDFGDLIGKTHAEASGFIQWHQGSMHVSSPPNGESIPALIHRVKTGIELCLKQANDLNYRDIVIICHRGTIRAAHIVINHLTPDSFMEIDIAPLSIQRFQLSHQIKTPYPESIP